MTQTTTAYAGWGARLGAFLIDLLPGAVLGGIGYAVDGPSVDLATGQQTPGGAIYWSLYALSLVVWGYNRWFLAGKTGQSWGRKVLGISLVGDATRQPIGAGKAFLRDLAHIVDSIPCLIGYLWPIWDAKKQTFSDKIVGTGVVRA